MSSPRTDDLIHRWTGEAVPVSFNAVFVALSFVVSLLGAGATLEMIDRRTSLKGLYNHLLLAGAAISMGGIAIWSMHFIGNRSIILLDGRPEVQLAYSIGITAASFFVPIVVLLVAFLAVNSNDTVRWWRVGLAGSLSGCAICGMHYLADQSITNYHCYYDVPNVVGAAFIAVSASTVALALFFVFRAAWNSSWIKRAGCTFVLAGAVSGMHWCASLGTHYTLLHGVSADGDGTSRNTTGIVVICLAVAASTLMIATAILTARKMKGYAAKAQQIVLAAAVFDKHGRILVSPEGLLPSEKITETFPQKVSHDDLFSPAHPLFHWMFRASRNWSSISALLGWMMAHLDSLPQSRRGARVGTQLMEENGQLVENYDVIFRELFCVAASSLATKMGEDLVKVGALWGEIFPTGMDSRAARPPNRLSSTIDNIAGTKGRKGSSADAVHDEADLIEKGMGKPHEGYGRGSLMFLVRHVESAGEMERLEAAGYRFAETHRVTDIIRSGMQIKTSRLEERLRAMASHSELDALPEPGVHVGFFAVRARLDKFGFDVMVNRSTRSSLPTARLPCKTLEPWQTDLLRELDGLPVQTLLIRLAMMESCTPREAVFASQLRTAIAGLRGDIDDPALDQATLSSRVVQMPCLPPDGAQSPATCSLLSLQLVLDINTRVRSSKCDFVPLQFLKVCQMVADNSPHRAAFSRALHREMSAVLAGLPSSHEGKAGADGHASGGSSTIDLAEVAEVATDGFGAPARPSLGDDAPSRQHSHSLAQALKPSLFGGIMVSQEIAIQVSDAGQDKAGKSASRLHVRSHSGKRRTPAVITKRALDKDGSSAKEIEMERVNTPTVNLYGAGGGFGTSNVEATEQEEEGGTFVDELFTSCIERRS